MVRLQHRHYFIDMQGFQRCISGKGHSNFTLAHSKVLGLIRDTFSTALGVLGVVYGLLLQKVENMNWSHTLGRQQMGPKKVSTKTMLLVKSSTWEGKGT